MSKKIPTNPKYEHVKSSIDTGEKHEIQCITDTVTDNDRPYYRWQERLNDRWLHVVQFCM